MMQANMETIVEKDIMAELERECGKVLEGAVILRDGLKDFRDPAGLRSRIKQVEHQSDEIVHEVFDALNMTFVPPLEREDIMTIAGKMDSILDMVNASVLRLDLYKIAGSTKPMIELSELIHSSVVQLQTALRHVRDNSKSEVVDAALIEVNRLENVADEVMNSAIAELFTSDNPIEVLKLKEIYEKLEEATDFCEDVADTLRDITAKTR